jgi:hypothetical protein
VSARAAGNSAHVRTGTRTSAQWYCLAGGAILVLLGALGFLADRSWDAGGEVGGSTLLAFEVNGWSNVLHLLTGALLLAAGLRRTSARTLAFLLGIGFATLAVWGAIDGSTVLGLLPVNIADHVLHGVLAVAGLATALTSPGDERLATTTAAAAPGEVGDLPAADRDGRFERPRDPMTGAPRDEAGTRTG